MAFIGHQANSVISYKHLNFLLTSAPSTSTISSYIKDLKNKKISVLVRCCEPIYSKEKFESNGISVIDFEYTDGHVPSRELVEKWLSFLPQSFSSVNSNAGSSPVNSVSGEATDQQTTVNNVITYEGTTNKINNCIAVHCKSGLGRAPVLVAIALIEAGMSPMSAIKMLRSQMRGCINDKQLAYLMAYKSRARSRSLTSLSTSMLTQCLPSSFVTCFN